MGVDSNGPGKNRLHGDGLLLLWGTCMLLILQRFGNFHCFSTKLMTVAISPDSAPLLTPFVDEHLFPSHLKMHIFWKIIRVK